MAKLRLATEGRAVLCGMTEEERQHFRVFRWRAIGDLQESGFLMIATSKEDSGLTLAKDGRLFIPGGQHLLNVHEELDLGPLVSTNNGMAAIFPVAGRTQPTPEKIAAMLARPVKPPPLPFTRMDMGIFDELTPASHKKGR